MKITIYDGYRTIGGNKIHLEEKGHGIFLDFGMNFSMYGRYYEEFLTERPSRGIYDLWQLGLIPRLNIYREDLLTFDLISDVVKYEKIPLNAIIVSHAHLDHVGNISFLKNDIPIVGSPETMVIIKSIRDTSTGGHFGTEIPFTRERKKEADGFVLKVPQGSSYIGRKMLVTEKLNNETTEFLNSIPGIPENKIESDGLDQYKNYDLHFNIKPYIVDHSILGATAYVVEGDFSVAYTGDLRFHGKRGEHTENFFKNAKNARILITEGTRIGRENDINVSEKQVYENAISIVEKSKDLIVADFSARNFERLETFKKVAEKTGREMVITAKDAYYLNALDNLSKQEMMKNLKIYKEYSAKEYRWQEIIYEKYDDYFIDPNNIKKNFSKYIICFSFYDMPKLLDLMPDKGDYIYSSSEAFGEEDIFSFERLLEWLNFFKFNVHGIKVENGEIIFEKGLHASGHASMDDLIKGIETMDPDFIIPVHTEKPEWFMQYFENTILLKNFEGKDF